MIHHDDLEIGDACVLHAQDDTYEGHFQGFRKAHGMYVIEIDCDGQRLMLPTRDVEYVYAE